MDLWMRMIWAARPSWLLKLRRMITTCCSLGATGVLLLMLGHQLGKEALLAAKNTALQQPQHPQQQRQPLQQLIALLPRQSTNKSKPFWTANIKYRSGPNFGYALCLKVKSNSSLGRGWVSPHQRLASATSLPWGSYNQTCLLSWSNGINYLSGCTKNENISVTSCPVPCKPVHSIIFWYE